MEDNIIEYSIKNNTSQLTIDYAIKLLERAQIFISNEKVSTDLEKFSLLKTMSMDICFSCELLLKTRINDYNDGNDYSAWNTHNLLSIFSKLSLEDQAFICRKLNLNLVELIKILKNDSTSDAFIKRYLYEENTGIPNYSFLCDFANVLLKLNNRDISFELNTIDTLSEQFDTRGFSFDEIIKTHSNMIYNKSQLFDLSDVKDEVQKYLVRNMKSCDFALFAELRYKFFDKNQNPKKEHEFSKLHKRLDEACKFLIAKSRYMDRYMTKDSTLDFGWALESLMFYENFNVGDTVNELYNDLNVTFEKSRYCTIEYFDNYYNSLDFVNTIKSITDLLMMSGDRANKIIKNKNYLLEMFGLEFLQEMAFTVEEMEKLDLEYITKLKNLSGLNFIPKSILFQEDLKIREKVFYFISVEPNRIVPVCIDYIVEETGNGYTINYEKYLAEIAFDLKYLTVSRNKIDAYIKLSSSINIKDIILYIIENNLDLNESINKYQMILNKCRKVLDNEGIIINFVSKYGIYFLDNSESDKIYKFLILYKYFNSEDRIPSSTLNYNVEIMEKLSDFSFQKIVNVFSIFKFYKLSDVFFFQIDQVMKLELSGLRMKLKKIADNYELLSSYIYNDKLFDIDIDKFIEFVKKVNVSYTIDLEKFSSGELEEVYEVLKEKNLLFLLNTDGLMNEISNNEILQDILKEDSLTTNSVNYNEEDRTFLGILVREIFQNVELKGVLLDLFKSRIVKEYPQTLKIFESYYSSLENVYRLNIYNSWYERIINNNIICNGSKIKLTDDKVGEIIKLFIDDLIQPYNVSEKNELSNRLELLFSNSQLVYSMNKDIFDKYDINFMLKIVNNCNFKCQNFLNINFFGNLFEVIYSNNLSEDKVLTLLNKLSRYKNNSQIIKFVEDISKCIKTSYFCAINFRDEDGIKSFNNELIDYLITTIGEKDEKQIISYISSLSIIIDDPVFDVQNDMLDEYETYEVKRKSGEEIFTIIKNKFITNITKVYNNVFERIANSYIANKIKIHKLNKTYNQITCDGDRTYEKKR